MTTSHKNNPRARGIVAFFAIILLALTALVCMAFFTGTSMNQVQAANMKAIHEAEMAAESGFAFMIHKIRQCDTAGSMSVGDLFDGLGDQLADNLDGTPNLGTKILTFTDDTIFVPDITLGNNRGFSATVRLISVASTDDTVRLSVIGKAKSGSDTITRRMTIDYKLTTGVPGPMGLKYGICSEGPINLGNNSRFIGINDSGETMLYSNYVDTNSNTFTIGNNGTVPGGVWYRPGAQVSVPSGVQKNVIDTVIEMPRYDPTLYKNPEYTGVTLTEMSDKNPTNAKYTNIIIKAGTNPTFGNDVTLEGIIYVEAPNNITFANNCNFRGIMVGDEAEPGQEKDCSIYFNNNMTVNRADTLPNEPQFKEIRELPNISILMPSFTMEFKNNMESFTGLIALYEIKAKNNSDVTVDGGILIYGPNGFKVDNNMTLRVSLTKVTPLGFEGYTPKGSVGLMPDYNTLTIK